MAKISERPVESSEAVRQEEARRQESTPNIKWRVIASYVLLTLLSGYTIYDYRIRPDCICRPRPYVFAISAFAISGLYGIIGILNRVSDKTNTSKDFNNLVYMLQMSLVLPLFASEVWALERAFRRYPDLVHIHVAVAVPGLANYFFEQEQKPWLMDLSIGYSCFTLVSLGIARRVIWIILAALMYTLAYLYSEKPQIMPKIEYLQDEEIVNYCMSGYAFCSKRYLG